MGNNCRTLIENSFLLRVQATRYRDLYSDLLKRHENRSKSVGSDRTESQHSRSCSVITDVSTGKYFKLIEKELSRRTGGEVSGVKAIVQKMKIAFPSIYSAYRKFIKRPQ